ncbi:MAG: DUF4080 domain-containing protein [Clostridiaceae bacterium]|jgi:radical SAM superfamily enzyme YgiQ (UPF0313 family)|nr:DUF4080 domain-containing protein [Clostridiaceae bacterium]
MKTILVAINAKYEHEGLAAWYLKAACLNNGVDITVLQYSINDSNQKIWSGIIDEEPDVACFSCYIWNRILVQNLISDLKKVRPETVVVVGGPEVCYEGAEDDFKSYGADYVIKGEGENQLPGLLLKLKDQENIETVYRPSEDLEDKGYVSPFIPEYLDRINGRISYIESSRGCPYNCSYCLSSISRGLEYFPLEEIFGGINALVDAGAKVIKFIDRSFNVNNRHSLEIWKYIKRFSKENVTFHFEINPDRLNDEQMKILYEMPNGLIQIEAGIQSTNPETLKAVSRVMDVDLALENIRKIMSWGNIHVHADLIAGLPYEDMDSFKKSFNAIYSVKAHHLQLGFLKLLQGTRIRDEAEKHHYQYRSYPPYEVLSNRYMSPKEIMMLKGIEEALDRFCNSGRLNFTLDYVQTLFPSAFDLYHDLSLWLKERKWLFMPFSAIRLYELFRDFSLEAGADPEILESLLCLDYVCSLKTTAIPEALLNPNGSKAGLVALEPGDFADREWIDSVGRNQFRRRFIGLEGYCPVINGLNIEYKRSRAVVDTKDVDPVTGRAGLTVG